MVECLMSSSVWQRVHRTFLGWSACQWANPADGEIWSWGLQDPPCAVIGVKGLSVAFYPPPLDLRSFLGSLDSCGDPRAVASLDGKSWVASRWSNHPFIPAMQEVPWLLIPSFDPGHLITFWGSQPCKCCSSCFGCLQRRQVICVWGGGGSEWFLTHFYILATQCFFVSTGLPPGNRWLNQVGGQCCGCLLQGLCGSDSVPNNPGLNGAGMGVPSQAYQYWDGSQWVGWLRDWTQCHPLVRLQPSGEFSGVVLSLSYKLDLEVHGSARSLWVVSCRCAPWPSIQQQSIPPYHFTHDLATVTHAVVTSKQDYCNSLYAV